MSAMQTDQVVPDAVKNMQDNRWEDWRCFMCVPAQAMQSPTLWNCACALGPDHCSIGWTCTETRRTDTRRHHDGGKGRTLWSKTWHSSELLNRLWNVEVCQVFDKELVPQHHVVRRGETRLMCSRSNGWPLAVHREPATAVVRALQWHILLQRLSWANCQTSSQTTDTAVTVKGKLTCLRSASRGKFQWSTVRKISPRHLTFCTLS